MKKRNCQECEAHSLFFTVFFFLYYSLNAIYEMNTCVSVEPYEKAFIISDKNLLFSTQFDIVYPHKFAVPFLWGPTISHCAIKRNFIRVKFLFFIFFLIILSMFLYFLHYPEIQSHSCQETCFLHEDEPLVYS